MNYAKNILETIGNTPLVQLNSVTKSINAQVLAKVETFNPGNSVKDRMALKMIEDAEADGRLKSGGTIIEGTSGNTGMGLAIAAIVKGYQLICVISDKQSKEKVDILRAVGAEVMVCPTDVEPDDPRSYYSVSKRLGEEIPNSWYVNQYDNPSNAIAHYEQTGPEIWRQTEGKITHFIVGVGTGGTISGVGKYLKEQNPNIKIWGIDTYGSVFKKYLETGVFDEDEIYSYVTEGIGEDILPKNVDFNVIDGFTKVTDKDAAVYTRKIALEEGIFVGNSAGAAIKGVLQLKEEFKPDDVVVVLFHDHGTRYVGKMFNDEWMCKMGYLKPNPKTVAEFIDLHELPEAPVLKTEHLVHHAIDIFKETKAQTIIIKDSKGIVAGITHKDLILNLEDLTTFGAVPLKDVLGMKLTAYKSEMPIADLKTLLKAVPKILVNHNEKEYLIHSEDLLKLV